MTTEIQEALYKPGLDGNTGTSMRRIAVLSDAYLRLRAELEASEAKLRGRLTHDLETLVDKLRAEKEAAELWAENQTEENRSAAERAANAAASAVWSAERAARAAGSAESVAWSTVWSAAWSAVHKKMCALILAERKKKSFKAMGVKSNREE